MTEIDIEYQGYPLAHIVMGVQEYEPVKPWWRRVMGLLFLFGEP